ncbi:ankyrin repeat domain-containing protein [Solirubrobacter sp. CPCC 204708]|uniref:Ankyrin repeat domain-containing protein n=1 Tax=Solirubrobacter deserti TaxID=2282478 RepID=A0ABT4RG76_9ACTN|nr:ankyrin repeat domain-containing protein [Solirubrobacter deserti]MBE2319716.1 ankyrin repeat domain-containing protein [Solirubrobacter deserti]MDA0137544.1 ankyrin repeat domain-containing protein [Solirubrobacter deserti]
MTLFEAAKAGDSEAVQALLRDGANVNEREGADHTCALHWAAAAGHLEVVRVLCDAGADVHGEGDDHALGVIGWATCWEPAQPEIAEFLIERGARHHIFSALALGVEDRVRAIVAEDPSALNRRMSRNEDHRLPLHFAVDRGRADMVELLIELGADPLGVDGNGHFAATYARTPDIDLAAMRAIHALAKAELVSADRGSRAPRGYEIDVLAALSVGDLEAAERLVGAIGPGVLHLMAKRGNREATAWLLEHGANPNGLWTHFGKLVSPLQVATRYGHEHVASILLEAGADPSGIESGDNGLPRSEPETVSVVLEMREHDPHISELLNAFEDGWVQGITSRSGVVRLELETPGGTWGAAVTLVEGRLERLPFDWRSHAHCLRP